MITTQETIVRTITTHDDVTVEVEDRRSMAGKSILVTIREPGTPVGEFAIKPKTAFALSEALYKAVTGVPR